MDEKKDGRRFADKDKSSRTLARAKKTFIDEDGGLTNEGEGQRKSLPMSSMHL